MRLTNDSYRILMGTRNFTELYRRDARGWLKVSARGRTFRMTAEQVLNHLLPALAGLRPGLALEVRHRDAPAPRGAKRRAPRSRLPSRSGRTPTAGRPER